MNATDILVMPVASYFVNMYFLGCLRFVRFLATLSTDYGVVALRSEVGEEFSTLTDLAA